MTAPDRKPIADFEPFPVDCLPAVLADTVRAIAGHNGCDPSFAALPMLSACASAIGTTYRLRLKSDWAQPAVVWSAIVAESGVGKSPALHAVYRPLHRLEAEAAREYDAAAREHEIATAVYQQREAEWKRTGKGEPPAKPEPPRPKRYTTKDTTREALAPILRDNPRGVLVACDELRGLLGSFGIYQNASDADEAAWLELWDARSLSVDRKGGARLFVPRAAVSIAGGIQPQVMRDSFDAGRRASGLMARFLFAFPPRRPAFWSEADIPGSVADAYAATVASLCRLEPDRDPVSGESLPHDLPLADDARESWREYYDRVETRLADLTGDIAAATSKCRAYAARLGLVLHLAERASQGDTRRPGPVTAGHLAAGIALAEWFERESLRVYGWMAGGSIKPADPAEHLRAYIRSRGGEVSVRDIYTNLDRRYPDAQSAEAAMQELADRGWGEWTFAGGKPGRPSKRLRLTGDTCTCEILEDAPGNGGCAGAGAAGQSDWGRL
jgi:hypothetical protein